MPAYFVRSGAGSFIATARVQGAWNTDEQHIAPSLGLLTHVLESDHRSRHQHPMAITRVSFDILGTLPIGRVEVTTRVIRAGRTVELVEATLHHDGRAAVIARAWLSDDIETAAIAGTPVPGIPGPEALPPWHASEVWPGEFVTTIDIRRDESEPGRARFWMHPRVALLDDEEISATARLLGLVDIANGITPRVTPSSAYFPNLDLTAHLFRTPRNDWIGFDTTVSFGSHGHGLTHSTLHDEHGPLGAMQQTLTVRPRTHPERASAVDPHRLRPSKPTYGVRF